MQCWAAGPRGGGHAVPPSPAGGCQGVCQGGCPCHLQPPPLQYAPVKMPFKNARRRNLYCFCELSLFLEWETLLEGEGGGEDSNGMVKIFFFLIPLFFLNYYKTVNFLYIHRGINDHILWCVK